MWHHLPNDLIMNILHERRLIKEEERLKKLKAIYVNQIRNIGKGRFRHCITEKESDVLVYLQFVGLCNIGRVEEEYQNWEPVGVW